METTTNRPGARPRSLAPSARALGENLANDLASDLARGDQAGVAILYGPGQYDNAFRRGVRDKFESELVGGKVLMEGLLDGGSSSQSRAIEQALAAGPDAIVLSLSAQGASSVFTEATLRDSSLGWKFSPLLKTPLFTQNISVELAEGATGIAPKIFDTTDDFPNAFAERWRGDQPLEGAYFYYDAISLLSIAFGLLEDVKDFSYAELGEAIVQASSSRGVSVGWDELDRGLEKLKEGVAVNYSGLTGPILLQPCGERRTGATQPWAVRSGEIVEVTE